MEWGLLVGIGHGWRRILRGRSAVGERAVGIAAEGGLLAVGRSADGRGAGSGDNSDGLAGDGIGVGIPDKFKLAINFCFLIPAERALVDFAADADDVSADGIGSVVILVEALRCGSIAGGIGILRIGIGAGESLGL